MTTLPSHVDWNGNERPATAMEVAMAESTAARIRREVAEIRSAAEQLATGNQFDTAVAEFLTIQATILERCGGTELSASVLRPDDDTREWAGMFPTAARSALLIARARLAEHNKTTT